MPAAAKSAAKSAAAKSAAAKSATATAVSAGAVSPSAASADAASPSADLPALEIAPRLERLRAALATEKCDLLVLTNLTNIRWLTGFSGSAGIVAVSASDCTLITDGRYAIQAPQEIADAQAQVQVEISSNGQEQKTQLRQALQQSGGDPATVGLEAAHISWERQLAWSEMLSGEPVPVTGLLEKLRQLKDPGEIARMTQAAAIVDEAMQNIFELLGEAKLTASEQDLAAELDYQIRRRGASETAFETIVASGPNSALPHARPGSRKIQRGELLLIDVGAVYDGYRSDMTRTFSLGEPSPKETEIWQVVQESQQLGVDAVRAGATTGEIDAVCRQTINVAGWGDAFMHSTGHGVGLDIHEQPSVSANTRDVLEVGEVITVEPGIYLADVAGVRLEDTVLVQSGACEPFTKTPKFLTL